MATVTFFHEFYNRLGLGAFNLSTDTFKIMLTATAPIVATHDDKVDLTEISANGGYAAKTVTSSWAETSAGSGVWRFEMGADQVWTATGAAFDDFRYAVWFDDTHASDALICYVDHGSTVSLLDTQTYTLDADADFEVFTIP